MDGMDHLENVGRDGRSSGRGYGRGRGRGGGRGRGYGGRGAHNRVTVDEELDLEGDDDDGENQGIITEVDEDADGNPIVYAYGSKKSFLSDSFHGSRRSLKRKAINALAVVSNCGVSTAFLTLTFNTNWPEVLFMLPRHQNAYENPFITCQVFKHRLDRFLYNLQNGVYFGGAKVLYIMRVIEYQNRGLPHAHIVFKLEGIPSSVEGKCDWIDEHICAEMPTKPSRAVDDIFGLSKEEITQLTEDWRYYKDAKKFMKHTCHDGVNGCLDSNGRCKRGNVIIVCLHFYDYCYYFVCNFLFLFVVFLM